MICTSTLLYVRQPSPHSVVVMEDVSSRNLIVQVERGETVTPRSVCNVKGYTGKSLEDDLHVFRSLTGPGTHSRVEGILVGEGISHQTLRYRNRYEISKSLYTLESRKV